MLRRSYLEKGTNLILEQEATLENLFYKRYWWETHWGIEIIVRTFALALGNLQIIIAFRDLFNTFTVFSGTNQFVAIGKVLVWHLSPGLHAAAKIVIFRKQRKLQKIASQTSFRVSCDFFAVLCHINNHCSPEPVIDLTKFAKIS